MWMELDGVECMSSSDGIDEDDATHHQHPFSKPHIINGNGDGNGNGNGTPVSPAIPPATSVHELLECPVCTNSMYPPIHQVGSFCSWSLLFFFLLLLVCGVISFYGFLVIVVINWLLGWLVFLGFWWLVWWLGWMVDWDWDLNNVFTFFCCDCWFFEK